MFSFLRRFQYSQLSDSSSFSFLAAPRFSWNNLGKGEKHGTSQVVYTDTVYNQPDNLNHKTNTGKQQDNDSKLWRQKATGKEEPEINSNPFSPLWIVFWRLQLGVFSLLKDINPHCVRRKLDRVFTHLWTFQLLFHCAFTFSFGRWMTGKDNLVSVSPWWCVIEATLTDTNEMDKIRETQTTFYVCKCLNNNIITFMSTGFIAGLWHQTTLE